MHELKGVSREELRAALRSASDALEAYWDAERSIEILTGLDEIPDLAETWIEPQAVAGTDISDAALDLFIGETNALRGKEK